MTIMPIYASLAAIFFIALSARVILFRRAHGVSLGDGGQDALLRRVRAHSNFVEYAPFGLLILLIAELQNALGWWLHIIGILLLVGRVLHGLALTRETPNPNFRVWGMLLTFSSFALGGITTLTLALF